VVAKAAERPGRAPSLVGQVLAPAVTITVPFPDSVGMCKHMPYAASRPRSNAQACSGPTPMGAIIVALVGAVLGSAYLTAVTSRTSAYPPAGFLALLPLFAAVRVLSPWRALGLGALWGAALFVFGTYPIGGLRLFSPTLGNLCVLSTAVGGYAFVGAALTRWIGFSPFVLGVGWMGVELALAPLGLHSGLLAGTQDHTALMDYIGRALGYVLVAFLVAYVNAALVAVFARVRLRLPRPFRITTSGNGVLFLRSQIVGGLSLVTLQPSHPRAPPF